MKEFDYEFQRLYPTIDKKAWREDHPDHSVWLSAFERVRALLVANVRSGGVSIAHDPPPRDSGITAVWLKPTDADLRERVRVYVAKTGDLGRKAALEHWNTKAAARDYLGQFSHISNEVAEMILR